jgi:hypothetical protein
MEITFIPSKFYYTKVYTDARCPAPLLSAFLRHFSS